jgi:DNA-binding Xre family transcriptional regulator
MMQNINFLKMFQKSGLTAYALSKRTGIPYTTIHKLCVGTLNINDCQYDTVVRIATCLGCRPDAIVNQTQLMRNVTGKYRGMSYIWKPIDGNLSLVIQENGHDVVIDQDNDMTQPRFFGVYRKLTECMIDLYIVRKEAEGLCRNTC